MAIESKNLLVWVKAMSRGQALPLDASEVHESFAAAQAYAATATAYAGQTVKALTEDGKYHEYILQPSEAGYTLEEVGAIKASDLKQYVRVVAELPTSGQEEGVLYIVLQDNPDGEQVEEGEHIWIHDGGFVWTGAEWVQVLYNLDTVEDDLAEINSEIGDIKTALDEKAPIANPVFTGTVKVGEEEVAVKSYVDGLIANMVSDVPGILDASAAGEAKNYKAGETYRVASAGTYFGHKCESGDLVIVLTDFSGALDAEDNADNVMVIQANVDGAVTSAADAATVGEIVVFDSVTGKIIKGGGVQIASLNDAIAKAHEHENKSILDTYDKSQSDLLAAAEETATDIANDVYEKVTEDLTEYAPKADTLAGYGITDAYTKNEIDAKLQPITENLNTKISATEADAKIAGRIGDIPTDTTVKSYIDTAVGSGGTASAEAIADAKQQAIDTSKAYTDSMLAIKVF